MEICTYVYLKKNFIAPQHSNNMYAIFLIHYIDYKTSFIGCKQFTRATDWNLSSSLLIRADLSSDFCKAGRILLCAFANSFDRMLQCEICNQVHYVRISYQMEATATDFALTKHRVRLLAGSRSIGEYIIFYRY